LADTIVDANNYDVLVAAWTQLRNLKSNTTAVLLHPSDYAVMILTKDSQGMYVFGAPNQNIPNLFGAPIVPHTAVTSDKYFLGDFTKLVAGQRAGLTVRFYDQNEDDAIKNLVTVVIEERISFAADRADRIIYGDFSADRVALDDTLS
jgi:HK97 family phage major capsid protein